KMPAGVSYPAGNQKPEVSRCPGGSALSSGSEEPQGMMTSSNPSPRLIKVGNRRRFLTGDMFPLGRPTEPRAQGVSAIFFEPEATTPPAEAQVPTYETVPRVRSPSPLPPSRSRHFPCAAADRTLHCEIE